MAEKHYKDDKLVSASAWKPDGEACPLTKIVDGSGILVRWHDNGQKELEEHWKNGKRDGLRTEWYLNGNRKEGHYKDGKKDGLWTVWNENGRKRLEARYKDGKEVSRREF